jgi:hypothetical protein
VLAHYNARLKAVTERLVKCKPRIDELDAGVAWRQAIFLEAIAAGIDNEALEKLKRDYIATKESLLRKRRTIQSEWDAICAEFRAVHLYFQANKGE